MGLAIPARLRQGVGACPPPAEFADAVEQYARRSNRHATLKFVPPPVNCWVVELTLRADDPAMLAVQQGKAEAPTEVVYLWRPSTPRETSKAGRPHMVGYKLDELGVGKMIELLEMTNTTTGRGQYASQTDAVRDQQYKQERAMEAAVDKGRQGAREAAEDKRRSINQIPFVGIGIDLKTPTTASGASNVTE